jgi:hypothetical protein
LFCGFAGAVNDLREAAAELAVMVKVGKTDILKRQMAELGNRFVNGDFTGFYLL